MHYSVLTFDHICDVRRLTNNPCSCGMPRVSGTCWTGTSRVRTSPRKTTSSRKASSQASTSDRARHRLELYPSFLWDFARKKLLFHRCMSRSCCHRDMWTAGNKQAKEMPSWHCVVEMNKYFWPLIVLDWERLLTLPFYKHFFLEKSIYVWQRIMHHA